MERSFDTPQRHGPRRLRPLGQRRVPRHGQPGIEVLRDRFEVLRVRAQGVVDEFVPPDIQFEAHRKGFHIATGILATPLVIYTGLVFTTIAAVIALVVIGTLEFLLGRYRIGIPLLTKQLVGTRRPGETFSWASTMFVVAALAILWLTPLPIALAALALLGLGDGMASLVGKAIGRNKLWFNPKKSWEGSLAGFLAGALGAVGLTAWYYAAVDIPYPLVAIVPICIAGALAAMVVESVPQWEDNFSVPIAASLTMTVLWMTTGLAPRFGPLIELVLGAGWPFS